MRNLKRVLSLALASVMLIGMMVVGASAANYDDFSDKDKIVNKEAVSTLVELGVIAGKDDGTYDPTGIVTRAEMAKMICVVLNGGKDPSLGNVTKYTYTDTVGHWAAPYIEFCTNRGIVAGKGDGTFAPNETVTGSQAAKMLLVAAGYQSVIEGLTGANWEVSTNVLANQVGLYDELDINPSQGLSRDNAAQMVYNALEINMVTYEYTMVAQPDGTFTSATELKKYNYNVLEDKFGAVKVEGIVLANEAASLSSNELPEKDLVGSALDAGKTKIEVTNDEDQAAFKGTLTFSVSSGVDMLGRKVAFYVKDNAVASKAKVIGGVMLSEDNKVVVDYSDDSAEDVLDDNNLEMNKDAVYYKNYMAKDDVTSALVKADGESGVERIFIDNNDDGEVDIVLVNYTFLGKVTAYTTKDDGSLTVKAKGYTVEADAEDVVGFDDVAKNDYVLFTSFGGKLYVEKAKTVEGEVKKFGGKSGAITSLTVDGTKYDVTYKSILVPTDLDMVYTAASDDLLDATAEFYLDAQGKIIAYGDANESAYTYCYVKAYDVGNSIDGARVKVVKEDGTTATYTISDDSAVEGAVKGTVYSYSINKDKEIELKEAKATEPAKADFTKGKASVAGEKAENSTVFFYVDGSDVDVYTGYKSAPSVENTTTTVYTKKDGKVAAVVFEDAATSASVGDHLFMCGTGSKGSDVFEAKVYLAGTDAKITVDVDDAYDAEVYGDDAIWLYTKDEDGLYTLKAPKKSNLVTGTVNFTTDGTIAIVGDDEYDVLDTTVTIDNDGNPSTPDAVIGATDAEEDDTVTMLVDDGDVLMIIITARAAD